MAGFYMKCNTVLKWINIARVKLPSYRNQSINLLCKSIDKFYMMATSAFKMS